MDDNGSDRDRFDRAETGSLLRSFAESRPRPPLTTVWTVRLLLGIFVALAGFFAFLASFVVGLLLVSLIAPPDQLPPIAGVPVLAVAVIITVIAVRAVLHRLRRTLGPLD
jgi:hypothetical protein